ncbi:hypothetical protein RCL1_007994 [Eukaryota sp. TZLM3-RCL]
MKEPLLAGRYSLGDFLGKGVYGQVYAAVDHVDGSRVAIKRVKNTSETAKSITRERLACCLDHPHVLPYLNIFSDGPFFYFVMPLMFSSLEKEIYGGTIDPAKLPGTKLSRERCKHLFLQLLEALYYLHHQSVGPEKHSLSHRDLKSANILVNFSGDFVICDFGLCNEATNAGMFQTLNVASPLYKSPDFLLFSWGHNVDYDGFALDYWSLGIVLYEAATGTFPFFPQPHELNQSNVAQIVYELIQRATYDESKVEDLEMRTVIKMLLNPDPIKRKENFIKLYRHYCS